mmetsp:Transcript_38709/g.111271  ORF Transcript_38709/g.111271 Transcript_38709/m.111271 type:complete len:106 (+) Transcript_38709:220-537(+)
MRLSSSRAMEQSFLEVRHWFEQLQESKFLLRILAVPVCMLKVRVLLITWPATKRKRYSRQGISSPASAKTHQALSLLTPGKSHCTILQNLVALCQLIARSLSMFD